MEEETQNEIIDQEVEEFVDEVVDNTIEQSTEEPTEEELLHISREEKCVPIAEEMIQIMARHKPSLAEGDQDQLTAVYGPIYKEIAELMLEKDLTYAEILWSMKVFMTASYNVNQYVNQRMQENLENAEKKLFSVDNMDQVTLQQIDNVLQSK